jgi:hypothetical protein
MGAKMLSYGDMPEDNADLAGIDVSFARLEDDSAESCPVPIEQILDYLGDEVPNGDLLEAEDLVFIRTAQVAEIAYWIWRFEEPDGTPAYATVSRDPDGSVCIGYDSNDFGLTPEQFMLGEYHNVF